MVFYNVLRAENVTQKDMFSTTYHSEYDPKSPCNTKAIPEHVRNDTMEKILYWKPVEIKQVIYNARVVFLEEESAAPIRVYFVTSPRRAWTPNNAYPGSISQMRIPVNTPTLTWLGGG